MMKIDRFPTDSWVTLLPVLVLSFGLPILTVNFAHAQDEAENGTLIAQTAGEKQPAKTDTAMSESSTGGSDFVEYDPLEPFNEKMFWFNREVLDRFVLKPVATAWDFVLPNQVQ
ncbi:MAG TPA: MlaA family lipoprotein, partial [Candidatus Binatia bacterium]